MTEPPAGEAPENGPSGEVLRDPLRAVAAWDGSEETLGGFLSRVLGKPVTFAGGPPPGGAEALFDAFSRPPLSAFSRTEGGGIRLPGSPHACFRALAEERWWSKTRPAFTRLPLPHPPAPGWVRQALARFLAQDAPGGHGACPPHPAWPDDPRMDRFRLSLHEGLLTLSRGPEAQPHPSPWPTGKRFAFAVTHDVDTSAGQALAGEILEEEAGVGIRSTFYLVGKGYRWDDGLCRAISSASGEVGLHGVTHDGALPFLSRERIRKALEGCRPLLSTHGIEGFRAPFLLDSPSLLAEVGALFRYDTSAPDTDTSLAFIPRRGVGTVFPLYRHGVLTVPITLPPDDRLLALGYQGLDLLDLLRKKVASIRERGGVALLATHPEPHLGGRRVIRDLYLALYREVLERGDAWVTTPAEIARFWRTLAPR